MNVDEILQCNKCWRDGHSTKLCSRVRELCPRWVSVYFGIFSLIPKCINCGGHHDASSNVCETRVELRNKAKIDDKMPGIIKKIFLNLPPKNPKPMPKSSFKKKITYYSNIFTVDLYKEPSQYNIQSSTLYAEEVSLDSDIVPATANSNTPSTDTLESNASDIELNSNSLHNFTEIYIRRLRHKYST